MLARAPNGSFLWTSDEDALIAEHYPVVGAAGMHPLLPHRTRASIAKRAAAIGVTNRPAWTVTDDKRLLLLWSKGSLGLGSIASQLGRSPNSVYRRAQELGYGAGVPRGFEFLTDAARRTGFHVATLRGVLEWADVLLRVVRSDPGKPAGRKRRHYVDPEQVDDAIERWLKTETLAYAARSRGVHDESLRGHLVTAGVIEDRKGSRARWRLPSKEIDRVVAERRAKRMRRTG